MANFAIIDGINVINTIVAESKIIAEEITGKTCIEFTDIDNAEPNGTYENGKFFKKKPYASWILDNNGNWQAPISYPEFDPKNPVDYHWDEKTISWVESY